MRERDVAAIIVAGGQGLRFGGPDPQAVSGSAGKADPLVVAAGL